MVSLSSKKNICGFVVNFFTRKFVDISTYLTVLNLAYEFYSAQLLKDLPRACQTFSNYIYTHIQILVLNKHLSANKP